jgi:surfactin synthase thioesterase subunit
VSLLFLKLRIFNSKKKKKTEKCANNLIADALQNNTYLYFLSSLRNKPFALVVTTTGANTTVKQNTWRRCKKKEYNLRIFYSDRFIISRKNELCAEFLSLKVPQ